MLDGMKNPSLANDDSSIPQILECVMVESKDRIKVVFVGGIEIEQSLN